MSDIKDEDGTKSGPKLGKGIIEENIDDAQKVSGNIQPCAGCTNHYSR